MCSRCMRTSVGTRVPGRCSRYVRTAVGTYLEQLVVFFFNTVYVLAPSVGTCSTYISRFSTHQSTLQPCLFAIYTYIYGVYIRTYISSAAVRSTYCTAVGIVRACEVGTVVVTVGT